MTTQLLIYKSAVPVNRTTHHDCFVEVNANYGFTAAINSVPLMAVEFPLATGEYPIVFGGNDAELTPVAILGMRTDENLFLGENGVWRARYIPAFVRRYPFVFSNADGKFVLCIDEEFAGFNREGRGERLFDDAGATTPYVNRILEFLQDYQAQFQTTQGFCHRIRELGLLESMTAQVTMGSGPPLSIGGFMAVSREKLRALSPDVLSELARNDVLELIYLHLNSLRNFDALRDRLTQAPPAGDPALH